MRVEGGGDETNTGGFDNGDVFVSFGVCGMGTSPAGGALRDPLNRAQGRRNGLDGNGNR